MKKTLQKKKQHFVPRSYLAAWCDPSTPQGHEPYVWVHSEDGRLTKNKSPEKIFRERDYYTVQNPDGSRDLRLEDALMKVETEYPRIRKSILQHMVMPTGDDLEHLCLYTALMLNRVKSARANALTPFRKMHEMTLALERQHNAPRTTSLETEYYATYGHHFLLTESLKTVLPYLARMNKALIFSSGAARFITSDRPCFLFDPKGYQLPPFYRSPGFARETVELRFPLAPEVMFVALWAKVPSVIHFADPDVEDFNRVVRFKCADFFVTQTNALNPWWFDPGKEPEDSWEKKQAKRDEA